MLPEYCQPCDTEPCCDRLYDAVSSVVDVAHAAILECYTVDCCDGFAKFVSIGEPSYGTSDYVAGWLSQFALVEKPGATGKLRLAAAHVATVNVKLMESGYPTITGVTSGPEVLEEETAAIDRATRHSMSHGLKVFDSVRVWLNTSNAICSSVRGYVPLRPVGPTAGLVGWTFGFNIELR